MFDDRSTSHQRLADRLAAGGGGTRFALQRLKDSGAAADDIDVKNDAISW